MDHDNFFVLKYMLSAIEEAYETIEMINDEKEVFVANFLYKNSLMLNIIQIGEMADQLTDEFKNSHPEIAWKEIKAMRNVAVHKYIAFDYDILWDTVHEDLPILKNFCKKEIDCFGKA